MNTDPTPNGRAPIAPFADGRDARGRFVAGNPGGPGNPRAAHVERLRGVLRDATTDADLRAVWRALLDKAKQGDVAAIREVLDRTTGKPSPVADDADGGERTVVKVICGVPEDAL